MAVPAAGAGYIRPAVPADPLAAAYVSACLDELEAPKPGNVGVHGGGHDMTVADFVASARVSAPPLCRPGAPLGERVLGAVRATRAAVGCNTNLGIVLLAAPLLMAAQQLPALPLDEAVERVLRALTVEDSDAVFEAIRTAAPAGLGRTGENDVHGPARAPLREVMAGAAARDRIALQYARGYPDVLDTGVALLNAAAKRFESRAWQTVALYLGLLARVPDTHVRRKFGDEAAAAVQQQARTAEEALERHGAAPAVAGLLGEFDAALKLGGINPGTTADLTVATLLARQLGAPVRSAGVRA